MADASLYVFVDNSNALIEGQRFAEAKKSRRDARMSDRGAALRFRDPRAMSVTFS